MNRYKKANEGIHAPEELKKQAARPVRRRSYAGWIGAVAAVLAVAILAGVALWPGGSPMEPAIDHPSPSVSGGHIVPMGAAVAQAVYPEAVPYPKESDYTGSWNDFERAWAAWREDVKARREMAPAEDGLESFYTATMQQFLGNSGGENVVYSPLSVYMALAMLAELTDGNSRQQVLDLLGLDSIEETRTLSSALWNANYRDDGIVTSRLAASLWLNENVPFVQETLDRLAQTYYASSYQGTMGSAELNQALRDWINEQTGGLLKEYADQLELREDTVLALAATIYFKVAWAEEFEESKTAPGMFHGANGDVTAEFMNQSSVDSYYWGDQFSAVSRRFQEGGAIWLILPEEGVAVDELLIGAEVTRFLKAGSRWENQKEVQVNLSMPRFDVSAQLDLIDGLKALGVTDVFDHETSDFSPMTQLDGLYVSEATHAARVKVDERGCEAAAFTVIEVGTGGMGLADEEVDFVLDRPFLFAITSETGQLLFTGVVNQV